MLKMTNLTIIKLAKKKKKQEQTKIQIFFDLNLKHLLEPPGADSP